MKYFLISYNWMSPVGNGHGDLSVISNIFPVRKGLIEEVQKIYPDAQVVILSIYQFPSELAFNTFYSYDTHIKY